MDSWQAASNKQQPRQQAAAASQPLVEDACNYLQCRPAREDTNEVRRARLRDSPVRLAIMLKQRGKREGAALLLGT